MRLPRIGIRVGDRLLSKLKFANVQHPIISKRSGRLFTESKYCVTLNENISLKSIRRDLAESEALRDRSGQTRLAKVFDGVE